ncbi:hypothetical protein AAMO2058_000349400 [Amorphochlora amoebiformis]
MSGAGGVGSAPKAPKPGMVLVCTRSADVKDYTVDVTGMEASATVEWLKCELIRKYEIKGDFDLELDGKRVADTKKLIRELGLSNGITFKIAGEGSEDDGEVGLEALVESTGRTASSTKGRLADLRRDLRNKKEGGKTNERNKEKDDEERKKKKCVII